MVTVRWCAQCGKYSAVTLGPNCRLHSTHDVVKRSDDFDALPFEEQLAIMMTVSLND